MDYVLPFRVLPVRVGGAPVLNGRRPDTRSTTARRKPDRKPPGAGLGPVLLAYDERVRGPTILVYSHRPDVREEIIGAVGRRPVRDLPRVTYLECDTVGEVLTAIDGGGVDLAILDGEAQPTGGIGVSRQIHMEAEVVPPVILVVRRADDRWLATWGGADEILVHPLDPVTAAECVAGLLRRRAAGLVPTVTQNS